MSCLLTLYNGHTECQNISTVSLRRLRLFGERAEKRRPIGPLASDAWNEYLWSKDGTASALRAPQLTLREPLVCQLHLIKIKGFIRHIRLLIDVTVGAVCLFVLGCGKTDSIQLPPVTVSSIQITAASSNLIAGQTEQLTAQASYSDGSTKDVTSLASWSSSDSTIATVSAEGIVTTLNAGATVIAATYQGEMASLAVTVQTKTPPPAIHVDILIYGATSSGIIAAVEASRLGKTVLLLDQNSWTGGMTANGLGFTDTGVIGAIGGLALEFYKRINVVYGSTDGTPRFTFAPHVAAKVFQDMLNGAGVSPILNAHIASVQKTGAAIQTVTLDDGTQYSASEFIDATYEGDLLALSQVSYVVGREAASEFNEPLAGVEAPMGFAVPIDPYVTQGDPSSGLLPHITGSSVAPVGSADKNVMAYNYRLCLTSNPANATPFTAPPNYTGAEFEILSRYSAALTAAGNPPDLLDILTVIAVDTDGPGYKLDLNNNGLATNLISTDDVGASLNYPDGSVTQRTSIASEHKRYMQALLYFLLTDPSMPASVRTQMATLGLCKDEFTQTGNWPPQLYVRVARRMRGNYVLTQNDLSDATRLAVDPVAIGSYNMDSHLTQRLALNGTVSVEGGSYTAVATPYGIPYASLVPTAQQATNLLVSAAISATNQAYKSVRIEPDYMMMGHAVGAAASLAIDEQVPVQQVDYPSLRDQLIADGQVLTWVNLVYLSVTPNPQGTLNVELYGSFPGAATLYATPPNSASWAMCSTTLNGTRQPGVQSVGYVNKNELLLTLNVSSSQAEFCDYNVNFSYQENDYTSNTLSSVPTQISGAHQIAVETSPTSCIGVVAGPALAVSSCADQTNTVFSFQLQGDGSYMVLPQIGHVSFLFSGQTQLRIRDLSTNLCLETASSGNQIVESDCLSTITNELFSIQ